MIFKSKKIIINLYESNYLNCKLFFKKKLRNIKSNNIEIECKNMDLSCKDILELIEIATQNYCKIISLCSSSTNTIISAHSLGIKSQYIIDSYSNTDLEINNKHSNLSQTNLHKGTVRSGEYIDVHGDLLILGDVNPGAIVSAEQNIIIWGRLLGIAHAGKDGNFQATISALQLKPVQLRIANKIARGPQEQMQLGPPEQAQIDLVSGKIVITSLDSNYFAKLNQKDVSDFSQKN